MQADDDVAIPSDSEYEWEFPTAPPKRPQPEPSQVAKKKSIPKPQKQVSSTPVNGLGASKKAGTQTQKTQTALPKKKVSFPTSTAKPGSGSAPCKPSLHSETVSKHVSRKEVAKAHKRDTSSEEESSYSSSEGSENESEESEESEESDADAHKDKRRKAKDPEAKADKTTLSAKIFADTKTWMEIMAERANEARVQGGGGMDEIADVWSKNAADEKMVPLMMEAAASVINRLAKKDAMNSQMIELRKATRIAFDANSSVLPAIAKTIDEVKKIHTTLDAALASGTKNMCNLAASISEVKVPESASAE